MQAKFPLFVIGSFLVFRGMAQTNEFTEAMRAGVTAMSLFHFGEAIPFFEKAVQMNEKSADAHIGLANALLRNNSLGMVDTAALQRANREELRALELAPNNAEALAGRGELEYRLGFGAGPINLAKRSTGLLAARELLTLAVAADPNNYHARLAVAHIVSEDAAAQVFQAHVASGAKPGVGRMSDNLKEKLRTQCGALFEEAIAAAKTAIRLKPGGFEAMRELAGVYFLRSTIDENPAATGADLKFFEEWAYKFQSAFARAQREANVESDYPQPLNFEDALAAGKKALNTYRYEAAVAIYRTAVKFNEQSGEAHIQLANALILTSAGSNSTYPFDPERLEEAEREDNRALELSDRQAEAMAGLANAEYALASHLQDRSGPARLAKAKEWARKSLASDSNNFHANYLLAHIAYQDVGKALFESGSQAYKNGDRTNPFAPKYMEPIRQKFAGQVDEGIRFAEKALEIHPTSFLASLELSNLYSVRAQIDPDRSNTDGELARQWKANARMVAQKNDPESRLFAVVDGAGIMGGILGGAPPPPPMPTMGPVAAGPATGRPELKPGGVTPPQLLSKVQPRYAEAARKASVEGTVFLEIVIDAQGKVKSAKVTRGLGLGLDESAIEAVQQWLFLPGMKDGHPVQVRANVEVSFRLLEVPQQD